MASFSFVCVGFQKVQCMHWTRKAVFFFSLLDVAIYEVSMIWGPTPKPIKVNRRTLN